MTLPAVRVRRLPSSGLFRRRPVYEVESATPPDGAARRTQITSTPSTLLRPVLGWDEAALVVRRADLAWRGGVGPWCSAFTGELSDAASRSGSPAPDAAALAAQGTSEEHRQVAEPGDRAAEGVRIRRLPDVRKVFWSRAEYEIEHVDRDGRRHRTATTTPRRELTGLIGSRHLADTSAWVEAADLGWDGGVGSWRSATGAGQDAEDHDATPSPDPRFVARHASRIVDSRRADSPASILPFLASILEEVGEPVIASEVRGLANDVLLARTRQEREQVDRRLGSLLARPEVRGLRPAQGSRTEREVCRLLLERAARQAR